MIRIIPELPDGLLDGILHYVPDNPMLEAESIKTLNKGKKTRYSINEYTYIYKAIFEALITTNENIWSNYFKKSIKFVKLDRKLVEDYCFLVNIFHDLSCNIIFIRVSHVNFNKFKDLDGHSSRMISDWDFMRGKYIDQLAGLNSFCLTHGIKEIKLPFLLRRLVKDCIKNSEDYKKQVAESINQEKIILDNYFKCGELELDLNKATIQYKNNKPVNISPENESIKFLVALLIKMNQIVTYTDLSNAIRGDAYAKLGIKDIAKDLQYIRRDLVKYLKNEVKIPEEVIKSMIINISRKGYKIVCG